MEPVFPICPSHPEYQEEIIAKHQGSYKPLPVLRVEDNYTLSRWKLSLRERLRVLWFGDVYLWVMSPICRPHPPVKLQTEEPK